MRVLNPLFIAFSYILISSVELCAQSIGHNEVREFRYRPKGKDFEIVNGKEKFNRALYGTNSAFRVETGDVPEFGLFMPNMGGNLSLGILLKNKGKWLNKCEYIKSIYRAGCRIYEIKDPILGKGALLISVLALSEGEGLILKVEGRNLPVGARLLSVYGGASDKRFSRNGDLGVDDPTAFDLKKEGCTDNLFEINANGFKLKYAQASKGGPRFIDGIFSQDALLKLGSAEVTESPVDTWAKDVDVVKYPILLANMPINNLPKYILLKAQDSSVYNDSDLSVQFKKAEQRRQDIAGSLEIETPDPYINTLGNTIAIAADGIWDNKTGWQHGAIGWRMPLTGWRAAYIGDVLGWHDRARQHFDGFANAQIKHITPVYPHPNQDSALNLARAVKKWGTQMYSNGYITRNPNDTTKMHHYDMNLVFIDELLWHFNWTGDWDYIRKMWPVLKLHLDWEKRNFDPDGDGLYDAYACIWASDALQYSSGAVTHSSAYNYRANKIAAQIAKKIGEDATVYEREANRILNAINTKLWLKDTGHWAEYLDFGNNQQKHPSAAVWTIYHAIDSEIADIFQAYQALRYIDDNIPHIPITVNGNEIKKYSTISTSNWMPYAWSINNVAFAEVAHTSLAYWQAGRKDAGFDLFKAAVLDGMYLGKSPGNIGQISFCDAARRECYRDFGDPIGVYGRAVVEGLFGIRPDAMNQKLEIRPGFPDSWNYASFATNDIKYTFIRKSNKDVYTINNNLKNAKNVSLVIPAHRDCIKSLKVNNKEISWKLIEAIGYPSIEIELGTAPSFIVEIIWEGNIIPNVAFPKNVVSGENIKVLSNASINKVYDPQKIFTLSVKDMHSIEGAIHASTQSHSLFVQLKSGEMTWWAPIDLCVVDPFDVEYEAKGDSSVLKIKRNIDSYKDLRLFVGNQKRKKEYYLKSLSEDSIDVISIPRKDLVTGTNVIEIVSKGKTIFRTTVIDWEIPLSRVNSESIDVSANLNSRVENIFKQEYLSPRSPYTSLQIPKQGIGEWCHPNATADIDCSGLYRKIKGDILRSPQGIPFKIGGVDRQTNNIAFTSLWDNYPGNIAVKVNRKAKHAYFLLAGTTNHMQSHMANGIITVKYKDGSSDSLRLVNPDTWAPIEQDYFVDGAAFKLKQPKPYRLAFKSGVFSNTLGTLFNIKDKEVYGRIIPGGAGIVLDLPLNENKEIEMFSLETLTKEVIIGLMAITIIE